MPSEYEFLDSHYPLGLHPLVNHQSNIPDLQLPSSHSRQSASQVPREGESVPFCSPIDEVHVPLPSFQSNSSSQRLHLASANHPHDIGSHAPLVTLGCPSFSHSPLPPPPTLPTHPMTTRFQHDIFKLCKPLNLSLITTPSLVPRNPKEALSNPHQKEAMQEEYTALIRNDTLELVPSPSRVNIIHCIWIFCHKTNSD